GRASDPSAGPGLFFGSCPQPVFRRPTTAHRPTSRLPLPPESPHAADRGPRHPAAQKKSSNSLKHLLPCNTFFIGCFLSYSSQGFISLSGVFDSSHGFRPSIERRSSAALRFLRHHSDRAPPRPPRAASPRSLGLPRAALFFCLARRQDPLQTNRHRSPLGCFATGAYHAGVYIIFRAPREAAVRGIAVSRFLFCRARSLDLFFLRSANDHQRRRGQPAAHHQGVFPAPHSSHLRGALRPGGLRDRLCRAGYFHVGLLNPPHAC